VSTIKGTGISTTVVIQGRTKSATGKVVWQQGKGRKRIVLGRQGKRVSSRQEMGKVPGKRSIVRGRDK